MGSMLWLLARLGTVLNVLIPGRRLLPGRHTRCVSAPASPLPPTPRRATSHILSMKGVVVCEMRLLACMSMVFNVVHVSVKLK